ncbi:PDDEXK nuclease domain-containing protein [Treponema bryantii]|uniref:PDDEXK nuclease domain-containing protein n=1 Tax=Treponema bryantii TaxID=163 RepID=UPI0003B37237|nr:PDDEXK nuclease domain-containing protein [Treponema bryantii]
MNQELITAVEAIKTAILQSQYQAAKETTRVQLILYYGIGRYLSSKKGKKTWGTSVLESISSQLRKELPGLRGFSASNLKNMRLFYENWSFLEDQKSSDITGELSVSNANSSDASDELTAIIPISDFKLSGINLADFPVEDFFKVPFSHQITIFSKVKNLQERYYYIHRVVEENLQVDTLEILIKKDAYKHQKELPNNFDRTITPASLARKAVEMFKDEYLLDFINVEEIGERDAADVDERVVENAIIHNVKNFIMTFGKDFAFVGDQYHLEAFNEEFFSDLLFFNRELNCLVVVELKRGEFKPAYLGQLSAYLRIVDDKIKKPHENRTIGIVLCKSMNKQFAEYVIQDYDKPMGVTTYKSLSEMPEDMQKVLPDLDDIKKIL